MPTHLTDHLADGRRLPGIFVINSAMSVGAILDELLLVWAAGNEEDYVDRIAFMPLI